MTNDDPLRGVRKMRELVASVESRCEMTWMMKLQDGQKDGNAVGVFILSQDGSLLVVEASIDADGNGSVTARAFNPDFSSRQPSVFDGEDSVLIST